MDRSLAPPDELAMGMKEEPLEIDHHLLGISSDTHTSTNEELQNLIKQYEHSESKLEQARRVYEELERIIIEDNKRDLELQTDTLSTQSRKNRGLAKEPSVTHSRSSLNKEGGLNISRPVQRRILQIEQFKHLMAQPKISKEKLLFLDLLGRN